MLSIHEQLSKIDLKKTQLDFDASILCPFAIYDGTSVYPKTESGLTFRPHMKDVYVEAFNFQTFNQDGNESAILKIKYYNTPNLKLRHLPVKDKVKDIGS